MHYAAMLAQSETITVNDVPKLVTVSPSNTAVVDSVSEPVRHALIDALMQPFDQGRRAFDRIYVQRVLAQTDGNRSEAARRLGVTRQAFHQMLKRSGLAGD